MMLSMMVVTLTRLTVMIVEMVTATSIWLHLQLACNECYWSRH